MVFRSVLVLAALLIAPIAHAQEPGAKAEPSNGDDLAAIGAKLNDPTSDVWALQFEFDALAFRGRVSGNDYEWGGQMLFQPIMPFSLTKDWKLITRPVLTFSFTKPIPVIDGRAEAIVAGLDNFSPGTSRRFGPAALVEFDDVGGFGDIQLPLIFSPKPTSQFSLGKKFSWGLGPTFLFPSASDEKLGTEKWSAGPVALALYKDKRNTVGVLGQYWRSFAGDSDRDDVSLLVGQLFIWRMYGTWQVGMNPIITYNTEATSGNRWTVPIGLVVGKTHMFGKLPMKIQAGFDYSLVAPRNFGTEWKVKIMITPVIPALVKTPLLELVQR